MCSQRHILITPQGAVATSLFTQTTCGLAGENQFQSIVFEQQQGVSQPSFPPRAFDGVQTKPPQKMFYLEEEEEEKKHLLF